LGDLRDRATGYPARRSGEAEDVAFSSMSKRVSVAQLLDAAKLDRCRGQAGAADRNVFVGRIKGRSYLGATDTSASRALP